MHKKTVAYLSTFVIAAMLVPAIARASADDDKAFLTTAAQSDQNEIALSQLAKQKATSAAVKDFASKMVDDHIKLTASMKPFAEKWGLTPPSGPDADHQSELTKLQSLSGADFDKEYVTEMVADHTKALSLFTTEAKTTEDTSFRAAVKKGRTVVAEHEKMAIALDKKAM